MADQHIGTPICEIDFEKIASTCCISSSITHTFYLMAFFVGLHCIQPNLPRSHIPRPLSTVDNKAGRHRPHLVTLRSQPLRHLAGIFTNACRSEEKLMP